MGLSPAECFGFSHMLGGYWGGQAEYLRVPMADVGPIKIPDSVTDEQALFLCFGPEPAVPKLGPN
jgi:threonine dehydrogenase-like Zn-dependent dehydrogenase